MNLKLYYNVASTYSQKALLAFFEKGVPFTPAVVNLQDPAARAEYKKLYPIGKIPLLTGEGLFIPESSIIIEFLENEFPDSGTKLIPDDKTAARRERFKDRVTDLYLNDPVASIFFDGLKPPEARNPEAVAKARETIGLTYAYMEDALAKNPDAGGADFNMSDCAAFAPLFYAQRLHPFQDYPNIIAYFGRLMARPSVQKLMLELLPALERFDTK